MTPAQMTIHRANFEHTIDTMLGWSLDTFEGHTLNGYPIYKSETVQQMWMIWQEAVKSVA